MSEDLSPTRKQNVQDKLGYQKILGFCAAAKKLFGSEDIEWIWIDTCCIDKRNSSELSEALNSMFRWYKEARICLAYLHDVRYQDLQDLNSSAGTLVFLDAEWFRRGWTLQELLAPKTVLFLDSRWNPIGYKAGNDPLISIDEEIWGVNLNELIVAATGIPRLVIEDFSNAERLAIEQKRRWMDNRETTRIEDRAYCQLGIFGVFIPPIYGEAENAFVRLAEEIEKSIIRKAAGNRKPGFSTAAGAASAASATKQKVNPNPKFTQQVIRPDEAIAIAKYTFDAEQPSDLGFRKGEIITIIRRSDNANDWWSGRIDDRQGIFPGTYVELKAQPGQAIALYSYGSEECQPGDLFFSKGDVITIEKKTANANDWWTGRIGHRVGLFPANYVKID